MVHCSVANCSHNDARHHEFTYFQFPRNSTAPELRKAWITACARREDWRPHQRSAICSAHFSPQCFRRDFYAELMSSMDVCEEDVDIEIGCNIGRRRPLKLCPDAVPTLHLPAMTLTTFRALLETELENESDSNDGLDDNTGFELDYMDLQSPTRSSLMSPPMQSDKALASLLRQAILNLCEQNTLYQRQLRVMGVLCLGIDSADVDVVVKLNDTLDKIVDAGNESLMLAGTEKCVTESRRKRKRLRPQRASVHFSGRALNSPDAIASGTEEDGLILFSTMDHSSEPLTCPVILPGEDDVSIGAATAAHNRSVGGGGGDPLLCMGAREEGEISPPPAHSRHHQMHHIQQQQHHHHNEDTVDGDIGLSGLTDGEECGALQVDEDTDGIQSSSDHQRANCGDTSGDEVEIMGEYRDFRKITLLGTTTDASGTSSSFIIPQLNPMVTGFITSATGTGSISLPNNTKLHITTDSNGMPSQVQFVTSDGHHQPLQIGIISSHISNNNNNNNSNSNNSNNNNRVLGRFANLSSTNIITMDETEAKVAQVVAAAQAAAAREHEAKAAATAAAAAAGITPSRSRNGSRRRRRSFNPRNRSVSTDISSIVVATMGSDLLDTSVDSNCVLSGATSESPSSLNCFAANRVFKCTFCGKTFNRKFCLERHERLHTGVKPYECAYCGERYIRLEDKKRHIRTCHPGKANLFGPGELSPCNTATSSPSPGEGECTVGEENELMLTNVLPSSPTPAAAVSLVGVPLITGSSAIFQ